ncbi:glutathione S-transferase family protein [Paroceanicella profunda]|uniref:Glutathione S-transferase family protein n=1 Tax=Paroceanicella profunda TaxID=2579971 RepID=A0A5B8FV75_9RHOB|nr:glutathione S-transferase family protein [Paroceanicella profunda]QDL92706.1 glutathione S-transferase family protein [Paroceanicella profunda]
MSLQRLFHQKLSPFSRKVRLALAEKRVEVALVEEKFWERRIDFLRLNPAGQVPVLEIDGLVLCDSTAICEYLDETRPDPALLPQGASARAEARRLAAYFDDKFHGEVTVNLLHERVTKRLMKSGYPDSGNIKMGLSAIRYHLDYIDWLADHRRWLAGDTMTIADLSAAAQISCLDYVGDVDWKRVPNAKDWYARIKSRPSFRSLLADSLPGFQVPQHYSDLDF